MDEKIKKIMSNILGVDEAELGEDSSIDTIEGWDSLNQLNLILAFEEAFDVSISEDEMIEMTSFTEIRRILKEKLSK